MTVDGVLRKNGLTSRSWEADLMQAAYLLELLCRYRLEAEMSRATHLREHSQAHRRE